MTLQALDLGLEAIEEGPDLLRLVGACQVLDQLGRLLHGDGAEVAGGAFDGVGSAVDEVHLFHGERLPHGLHALGAFFQELGEELHQDLLVAE